MNQYNEELFDPKGQGKPPAYTTSDSAQDICSTNNMRPHMHGTMGYQIQGGMMQVQPTGMMHPTGIMQVQPVGMMQPGVIQPVGMMQPVGIMQPTGMMYPGQVVVPMVVGNQMGRQPAPATCPSCKEVIVTRVEAKATMRTHIFALMMCMLCLLPCALIPYCTDTCRNADHYCPKCNSYIGSHVNY